MGKKHDLRYKRIYTNPLFIEKLLTSFVNEQFIKGLDFSSIKRLDKSFIDSNMRKKESDLVYEIYFKKQPVYFYLLLEFQSTVDRSMPLRFLRYILELSESYGRNKQTKLFPAVFPLLIYNGDRRWTAKLNPNQLYEKSIPSKYIPNFEYYPS